MKRCHAAPSQALRASQCHQDTEASHLEPRATYVPTLTVPGREGKAERRDSRVEVGSCHGCGINWCPDDGGEAVGCVQGEGVMGEGEGEQV